jgi:hypothetical protein
MKPYFPVVLTSIALLSACTAHSPEIGERRDHSAGQAHQHTADSRAWVAFSQDTKDFFLKTMRQNLSDINEIHRALADGDLSRAEHVAEFNLGLGSLKTHNALATHMPLEMQNLGMEFHNAGSALARALREQHMPTILQRLADMTHTCVMCHSMYRVN